MYVEKLKLHFYFISFSVDHKDTYGQLKLMSFAYYNVFYFIESLKL